MSAAVTPPVPIAPTLVPAPAPTPLTLDRRGATAPTPARFALGVDRPGVFCLTAAIDEPPAAGAPPGTKSARVIPLVLACGGPDGAGPFVDLPLYGELTLARFEPGYYVILVRHPDPDRSGLATVKAWRADPARPAVGQAGANP